jgi:hypothetical protein
LLCVNEARKLKSGFDVMIPICRVFPQFSAKKLAFSSEPYLHNNQLFTQAGRILSKKRQIFRYIFLPKIFQKIITSVPGRNLRDLYMAAYLSITNRLYSLKMRRKKNTKFDLHSKS